MTAASPSAAATTDAHRAFDAALPRIDAAIRYHFRRRPRAQREEAIAEAVAYTWAAWHGLLRRGKDPVAVGVVAIAANACRAVKKGRSVGANRSVGRGAMDVHHPRARLATGLRVVSLEDPAGVAEGTWRDWLATGRRYGPADEAAFRVDFAAWLAGLPGRKRRAAELLAEGLGTGEVACRLGVTPGAVSQARGWLARSWGATQGEADARAVTVVPPVHGTRFRGAAIVDPHAVSHRLHPHPPPRELHPHGTRRVAQRDQCPGRPDRGRHRRRPGPFLGRLRGDGGPPGRPRPPSRRDPAPRASPIARRRHPRRPGIDHLPSLGRASSPARPARTCRL